MYRRILLKKWLIKWQRLSFQTFSVELELAADGFVRRPSLCPTAINAMLRKNEPSNRALALRQPIAQLAGSRAKDGPLAAALGPRQTYILFTVLSVTTC